MNIDDLTLGQIKQLKGLLGGNETANAHPFIGKHCIIRTYAAGVHFGVVDTVLSTQGGTEIILKNARRLWKWDGAFTLSEVATKGVKAANSRIAVEIPEIYLTGVIEFIPTTEAARKTFEAVNEK